MKVLKLVMLLAVAATLLGCQVTIKSSAHTYTPAHSYYERHPNLHRYDSELGLYIFLESPNTYYSNNYYYRWFTKLKRWERAKEPYGSWRKIHERKVPSRLVKEQSKINRRPVNQRDQRPNRVSNRRALNSNTQQGRAVNEMAYDNSQNSWDSDRPINQKDNRTTRGNSKKDYIEECEENGKSRGKSANRCRN